MFTKERNMGVINNLMDERYERLGFKTPSFLENSYGIRIYLGTKGEEDWCVFIPKRILRLKVKDEIFTTHGFYLYLVTEKTALETAERWTTIAKESKRV